LPWKKEPILVYGHKANTLRWAKKYLKEGADGLEVDIYQRGQSILVEHTRLGSKRRLLRERIGSVIASFHVKPALPLREYLSHLPLHVPLMLDLKNPVNPTLLKEEVEAGGYSVLEVVVSSRWHSIAQDLKARGFEVLLSIDHRPMSLKSYEGLADGVSINVFYVDSKLLEEARDLGFRVALWIINDVEDLCSFTRVSNDVIIVTDYPKVVKRELGKCVV
jgi:hypothetical protein